MSVSGTPSPELEASIALINQGCKEIQALLDPTPDGQISPVNMRSVIYFMPSLLQARLASERDDYEHVASLLAWVKVEVAV